MLDMDDAASPSAAPGTQSPTIVRRPVILWGRLVGALSLGLVFAMALSVGIPFAFGIGSSGAYVVQAWVRSVVIHAGWDKKPSD
jgi:homoserine kinase